MARRRGVLVFVEVKARGHPDDAAYAVGGPQMRRIVAAAEAWLARHPEHGSYAIRFDAMLVTPWRLPRHIQAAFEATP